MADVNARELSQADPKKQARAQKARKHLMETSMRRSAAGEYRWALTLFPTHAYASEAGMSLREYEDFYYAACLATDGEPVTAWERQSDQVKRLAEWIQGKEEVHIQAPGHRHHARRGGRRWIPCVGEHNMPDGEFFTGPVEDSVDGEVALLVPGQLRRPRGLGRALALRGRQGRGRLAPSRARSSCIEMLDTDAGARRLGELGIGTNYGIATGTKEILLDEKIGGTVHMAIGMSYPETGGTNSSAVHWDMVCDLRQGGSITVDGDRAPARRPVPGLSLDPPILTAFPRRNAVAMRRQLAREGFTLAPLAAGPWLGLRRGNARQYGGSRLSLDPV